MGIQQNILEKFADEISEKISRKTISSLQKIKNTLSGDDTGLKNAWDEICLQKQDEESIYWGKYDDIVQNLILVQIKGIKEHEKLAILLQTEGGFNLEDDNIKQEIKDNNTSFFIEDLARHISDNYVYEKASIYKNKRIKKYLNP